MIFKRLIFIILLFFPIYSILLFGSGKISAEQDSNVRKVNEDTLLFFDEHIPKFENFSFDIDESKRLKPKANDFELKHFSPMSNKNGERWVLITVRNNSSGRRFLKSEYLVATFANGDQANPKISNESIDAEKTFTKTISFGVNKFPIVMLEIQP